MATLPITSGNINLTDVASFFNVTGNTNLADYTRGGGIVPPTGPATTAFPATGGVGFFWDNPTYSRIQDDNNNDTFWPTQAPDTIVGVQNSWTYTPNTTAITSSANVIDNSWWNTSTDTFTFAAGAVGSMTVDITNWDTVDTQQEGNFVVRKINNRAIGRDSYTDVNNDTIRLQNAVLSQTEQTVVQITAVQSFSIAPNEGLRFFIAEGSGLFTPYDIRIHSVLLSFTTTPYAAVTTPGADINTGISETVNGLNLNQFYGVDDGEA